MEGDPEIAEMLHLFFALMELECSVLPPGEDAVPTLRRLAPDVLILDFDLPHPGALEIARLFPDVTTIFLSRRRCERADAARRPLFVPKPHTFEDLLRLFEIVLTAAC